MSRVRALVVLASIVWVLVVAPWSTDVADSVPSPDGRPNIVLFMTDDQTIDSMSQGMPFLNSRPGGQWVEFSNAFVNTPLCCPSRASILTGLYAHHSGVRVNQDGPRLNDGETIATWLDDAGYRTTFIGKYLNGYPWGRGAYIPPGWDEWFALSGPTAESYYGYTINDNGVLTTYGSSPADYQTDVLAARAESLIMSTSEPFFMQVAPLAPHLPATPAPRHATISMTVTRSPNFNEADVSDKPAWVRARPLAGASGMSQWDTNRAKTFRTLRAADDMFRDLYEALEITGKLDNTVIVFLTDNGNLIGEHRLSGKSCVYEECVRTPMLVRYPGAIERVDARLVSNVDLAPTFTELAGFVPPVPVDGLSLVPLLEERVAVAWRESLLLEHFAGGNNPPFWAIRTDSWKYSELGTGERELYDLVNDPFELQNVADQLAYAPLQAELAAQLTSLKAEPARQILPALTAGDASATEGTGALTIPVTLSLATSTVVTVDLRSRDGDAIAGEDYVATSGQVTFQPGELTGSVDVALIDDPIAEPAETFSVVLEQATGATVEDAEGVGTILDDDVLPGIEVRDAAVAEGDGGLTAMAVAVQLTAPVAHEVTVDVATVDGSGVAGEDYVPFTGTVAFAPGQVTEQVTIDVQGDTVGEPDETVTIELSNPWGGILIDPVGVGTIVNDDPFASLSIDDVSVFEGDTGTRDAEFTVRLSVPADEVVTVRFETHDDSAWGGTDYLTTSGTLSIPPGETQERIRVQIIGDRIHEPVERFVVLLSEGSVWISDAQGIGSIQDDEPLPTLSVSDVSKNEGHVGTTPFEFVVSMSGTSSTAVTVSFATLNDTARAGSDYQPTSGIASIPAGATSTTIVVLVNGDTTFESGERFFLDLSGPFGASILDGRGIGTIRNDDSK